MAFPLTEEQQKIVTDRGGELLVSAAAGSGKTRVLVERLMELIVREGEDIDRFLPGGVCHVPPPPDDHVPGGEIQHAGLLHGLPVEALPPLFQGKQIQQHLQPQAVKHLGQIKGLPPRLIVHHPEIQLVVLHPSVHPVYTSGNGQGHPIHHKFHRGQFPGFGKTKFKGDRAELRGPQFLHCVLHHRPHRPQQTLKQIFKAVALLVQSAQIFPDIALHRLIHRIGQSVPLPLSPLGGIQGCGAVLQDML